MSLRSPKILLSGASGMLGRALQRALGARDLPILQLVRPSPPKRRRWFEQGKSVDNRIPQAGVAGSSRLRAVAVSISGQVSWNPAATPAIAHPEVLEEFDAAIHLCGVDVAAHRWTPAYKGEIASSRVQSTRALSAALGSLRHPPQVLLVASATGIYGSRGDELLDEGSAAGSGFLAELCQEWEAAAQPARDAGIRVVPLRLGVVLGPGGGALARLLPVFRLGLGGRLGSGRQWMSWISLADAVAAILFAMETPTLAGAINLTAPQPVTNIEFTRALARAVHRPAILPAPAFALRLALGEVADEALLASARVFPSGLTSAGFRFAHSTVDEALAAALATPR